MGGLLLDGPQNAGQAQDVGFGQGVRVGQAAAPQLRRQNIAPEAGVENEGDPGRLAFFTRFLLPDQDVLAQVRQELGRGGVLHPAVFIQEQVPEQEGLGQEPQGPGFEPGRHLRGLLRGGGPHQERLSVQVAPQHFLGHGPEAGLGRGVNLVFVDGRFPEDLLGVVLSHVPGGPGALGGVELRDDVPDRIVRPLRLVPQMGGQGQRLHAEDLRELLLLLQGGAGHAGQLGVQAVIALQGDGGRGNGVGRKGGPLLGLHELLDAHGPCLALCAAVGRLV